MRGGKRTISISNYIIGQMFFYAAGKAEFISLGIDFPNLVVSEGQLK